MDSVITALRNDLNNSIDENYRDMSYGFFKKKELIHILGVRYPQIRKIASEYYEQIKTLPKKEIYDLCKELLESKWHEERVIAFQWIKNCRRQYDETDFEFFKNMIEKYVTNWAACDDVCCGCFGNYLLDFPKFVKQTYDWSKSSNRWLKRASIVALLPTIRKQMEIGDAYKVADILLEDKDDLVQKAWGWVLRECGKISKKKLYDYVMKNKDRMGRTGLRYSIEKFSKEDRMKLMK